MVLADRVRFPVPLFIYAKWCVSMIKTVWNIYIKQKTRNLTRIPIFAMIGGVRMCDFCEKIAMDNDEYYEKRYAGGDFIFKDENGFGVLIDTGDSGCLGYIKVNYFPICGRKLV